MLFNSLSFLFVFLPIAYGVYWMLRTRRSRYAWLAFTGYVFYSFWSVPFCSLMLLSTLVSYLAGLGFARASRPRLRLLLLIAPVGFDLALLGYFKYAGFLSRSINRLFESLGTSLDFPILEVTLPIGISFYTFHTITYIVDCYRRTIKPTSNFLEFAAYVSLFPQLVAGPIVRFRQIEKDLDDVDLASRTTYLDRGWALFVQGLAKKVLIADTLAAFVDPGWTSHQSLSTAGLWLIVLGYTYQLYFDFSGYSDMAMGLGLLFGLRLPWNFNSPYKAVSIADFWRRWHISLSSVLRDYLYIPLGGNRLGAVRANANLVITMLLGGLWHGAAWSFIAWGGYHGALLVLHRSLPSSLRVPAPVARATTFLAVVVGWVLFRAPSMRVALDVYRGMFVPRLGVMPIGWVVGLLATALALRLAHFSRNTHEMSWETEKRGTPMAALLFVAALFLIYSRGASPFLYFQF